MFLSLPHSLLALVICLLETRALADSPAPSPSPTAHFGNVGDYVASGLGINNGSTSHTGAPIFATTGSGQEYASSCADALSTWSSNSFAWQWANDIVTTSTFSSAFTETIQKPGSTKVTSVITLCDGYPRVVGHTSVSTGGKYTSTVAWTNTITASEPNHAYPTPAPCSIRPDDCKTLSSSYNKWLSKELSEKGFATVPAPQCTITPSSSMSYSKNTRGQTCDNCMIAASTARVMFWPVTTSAGADLCNQTGSTITASPTGPPNSFVTEGITITSPTVAVSLGYMSRVDGCGTTIDHTIIPVHPDQVSSVRGFRALFSHHRFNFADLNYFCMNANTTNATIADGEGDSCYQQVPADAYFGGLNNAVVLDQAPFRNLSKSQMTIFDNYQPQLLPPQTMTKAITSLWGNDCIIHPDGVWDPPIALTPEAQIIVPTYPGGDDANPECTPASPINSYGAVPPQTGIVVPTPPPSGDNDEPSSAKQHFTALPEVTGGISSGSNNGQGSGYGSDGSGSNGGSGDQGSGSGSGDNSGSSGNNDGEGSGSGGDGSSASQNDGSGSNGDGGTTSGESDGSNGKEGQSSNSGSGDNGGSNNDSGSGNSAGQQGAGGVTQVNVHTTIMTIGGKVIQCTQDSNGAWIIPDASTTHTVSSGGSAVEIDAATLTAGPNGLVNVNSRNTVLTVGNKVMTASQDANGAWIIPDAHTTHTVSQGGSAVEVDGVAFTAASQGLAKTHASGDSESSESSGTGTQSSGPNRAQSTSATATDGEASATSTDSSAAGAMRWSPAFLASALLSLYVCML